MARQGLRASDVRIEQQRATTARATRRPEYNFGGVGLPIYTLIPTAFAPVLAGDTVATGTMQVRAIGTALPNQQATGVWFEHWCFYVRIGDMADAESIRELMIDPASSATIDWRDQCMQSIWKAYFRDESESLDWSMSATLRVPRTTWWDSARDAEDLPDVSGAADDWEADWIRYQAMRRAKLTTKTWEEFLGAQGVNVPPQLRVEHDPEFKLPELMQYSREFVYPQMSLAPTSTGTTPVSTTQWFINDRLKRSRFCAEPGFVVTCVAVRPKVYLRTLNSAGNDYGAMFDPLVLLNDAEGWMPIDLDTDPHASLTEIPGEYFGATGTPPTMVVDTRDLFLNGADEFWAPGVGAGRNTLTEVSAIWDSIPLVLAKPASGSRPDLSGADDVFPQQTFAIDSRVRLGVKSRVNKDTTR